MDTVFYPDYTHSILNITNTILHYYGVQTPYGDLPVLEQALKQRPKNVVLLIMDGLGVDLITKMLPKNSFLRRHIRDKISSVFPPTTTTATTTYYTGLPPIFHGWLGWAPYFKECHRNVELFTNLDNLTQEPAGLNVQEMLPYTHIFEKIKKVSPKTVLTQVFPKKIIGDSGVKTFSELTKKIAKQARVEGEQFILSYWAEPDHACHHYGTYAQIVKRKITFFNRKIEELCQNLTDTVVIISADHGHIPTKRFFYIEDCPELAETLAQPISMEERAAVVFLKKGYQEQFLKVYRSVLSRHFLLLSQEEVINQGLLGTGPMHRKVTDFLGDYVLIAKSEVVLRHRQKDGLNLKLKSAHAGLTKREMLVPLIVIQK